MIDNWFVGLQNNMDVEKYLPSLYRETCPLSSPDVCEVNCMKVREEDDHPVPLTWESIKAEHEVSFMTVWPLLSRFGKYTKLHSFFLISVCPSVYPSFCLHKTILC
jgi:hypothetical protein